MSELDETMNPIVIRRTLHDIIGYATTICVIYARSSNILVPPIVLLVHLVIFLSVIQCSG